MEEYYNNNDKFIDYCKNKMIKNEDFYTCIECFELFEKKEKKKKIKPERIIKYCFITLQNFKQRIEDIEKFELFCKKIDYLYHSGFWCIEQGKTVNTHLHLLVLIRNPKKHKQQLGIAWAKIFENNILEKDFYKLTQHRDTE